MANQESIGSLEELWAAVSKQTEAMKEQAGQIESLKRKVGQLEKTLEALVGASSSGVTPTKKQKKEKKSVPGAPKKAPKQTHGDLV